MSPPGDRTTRRRTLLRLSLALGSVVACGLLLLGAELVTRLSGRQPAPTPTEVEYVERTARYLDRCRRVSLHGGRLWLEGTVDRGEPRVTRTKRAGVRRIVVVGESSAGMLANGLSGQYTCDNVEVIDCAQGGSGLEHMQRRFDEVLDYQADAILVLFGHNLALRYETDPLRARVAQLRTRSRLLGLLSARPEPRADPTDRIGQYERWLAVAARRARAVGARLVVDTPMGNPWFAPGDSRGPEAREQQALRFLDASGRASELDAMLQREPPSAQTLYERGLRAGEAGRVDDATAALAAALELSSHRTGRAPPALYTAVRRAARQHGIALVDGDALLRAWAGPAPDWTHFADAVHPSFAVMRRVARANVALLDRLLGPVACPLGERSDDQTLSRMLDGLLRIDGETSSAWSRSLEVALSQWLRAEPTTDAVLARWVAGPEYAAAAPDRRSRVLAGVCLGYARLGRAAQALALAAQAPPPGGPTVAFDWALCHLRAGRPAEARARLAPFASLEPARSLLRWMDAPAGVPAADAPPPGPRP